MLFKRKPGGLVDYEKWLQRHRVPKIVVLKDKETASHEEIMFSDFYSISKLPNSRLISDGEAAAFSEKPLALSLSEAQGLSLENTKALSKIAFTPFGLASGRNRNLGMAVWAYNASDSYCGVGFVEGKGSAYCFWPRNSSNMFGSAMVFDSFFCINTYYSKKVTRSFELDGCTNCSDVYFAHNCENVQDSMFCFNAKNMRNAIGNSELPPDDYREIKASILEQIANELIRKKDLRWNIYNIGCYSRG